MHEMALSIGELLQEAGKLLPKRHLLNEEKSENYETRPSTAQSIGIQDEFTRPILDTSLNQEEPPLRPSFVCNLNFNNDASVGSNELSITPRTIESLPAAIIKKHTPEKANGYAIDNSKSRLRSKLAGYELLKSKPSTRIMTSPRPRRRKSRNLGTVSKKTEKLIIETNEDFASKMKASSQPKISHSVTEAVLSLTKVDHEEETILKGKDDTRKEESKEEEDKEEVDELDDVLPPLESDICPIEPKERRNMKRNIHRRSSLYLEADIINLGADMNKKTKAIVSKFRGGVVHSLEHITDDVREDYESFLSELDDVVYYAYRQAEMILENYSPRTIVLISSAVPKAELLLSAVKPGVLSLIYDVTTETYKSLLGRIKSLLDGYKFGAKARRLAFVCKGGPGYMYLLQSKPITSVKLLKEEELLKFWKTLGSNMSKRTLKDPSVIHIMESNVAGISQGEELLSNLEAAMFCHQVKVESPLELEPKGREMISTYFQPEKFSVWKSRRYSKFKLYK